MRRRQAGGGARLFLRVLTLFLLPGAAACAPTAASLPPASTPPAPSASTALQSSPATRRTDTVSPTLEPSATPDCTAGQIESLDVPSSRLSKPLHASVYLPPCYAIQADRRYPVLYLFHGIFANDEQWISIGVDRTADRLIAAGQVTPFIIVMPYDPSTLEPPQDAFGDAVVGDLVPAIDGRYRTLPDRIHRAAGGLSRGSGWALRLGLTHPELFGAIGMHSVVVFGSDGPLVDNWLAAIPSALLPRLWLDIGDHDGGLASARILEDMLTAEGIPHEWHLNIGSHDRAYWSAHVEEYLRWYAAGW